MPLTMLKRNLALLTLNFNLFLWLSEQAQKVTSAEANVKFRLWMCFNGFHVAARRFISAHIKILSSASFHSLRNLSITSPFLDGVHSFSYCSVCWFVLHVCLYKWLLIGVATDDYVLNWTVARMGQLRVSWMMSAFFCSKTFDLCLSKALQILTSDAC